MTTLAPDASRRSRGPRGLARATSRGAELEMTPMIDVTFLLLVFFLCTLQFKTLDAKLAAYLPKDVGHGHSTALEPVRLRIDVVREDARVPRAVGAVGAVGFGPDRELAYRLGPLAVPTPDELLPHVLRRLELDPLRGLVVDVRDGVTTGEVVTLVDRLFANDVSSITFAPAR